jgi:putative ABC transport system ATP-binding protein
MNDRRGRLNPDGSLIQARHLTKTYRNGAGAIEVLKGVSLSLIPGELLAIMGPSGSGKSTLLFILGLLLQPSGGSYWLAGDDVFGLDRRALAACRRERLGFVFQTCDLLENSTVYENLEFPLIYAGVARQQRRSLIERALEQVNLGHRLHHPANQLSGGERQRVAVARALVNRPRVILADEPTGQLDHRQGHLVMDHFEEIAADGDTAVIIVTHDPEIAARCSRVLPLRDGRLAPQRLGLPAKD